MDFFSSHTIFFTLLGYHMSYLEFFGTILNIAAVWYAVRNNILTWAFTIVADALFVFLFYQFQLYSDMMIQVFYIGTGVAGLWVWARRKKGTKTVIRPITRNSRRQNVAVLLGVVLGTLAWGTFMSHIHTILPHLFPKPAAYPYVDASITIMAIIAQVQLIFRKFENWYLWIFLDVIAIGVYYSRGIKFVSLLYVIFLGLSVLGVIEWRKQLTAPPETKTEKPALKEKTA